MSMRQEERDDIRRRIIEQLGKAPEGFSAYGFAKAEGLTTSTIYRYLAAMEADGEIQREKRGRKNVYRLTEKRQFFSVRLAGLSEDDVWRRDLAPFFCDLPKAAKDNLAFAFTEMLNNAIDHSDGTDARIGLRKNGYRAEAYIADNGVGIFTKIADAMKLEEKSFAVLELAKGKFTTEPDSHTGEGVFFSSKVMDEFVIFSDGLVFLGDADSTVPIIDRTEWGERGTLVVMSILYGHSKTAQEVFDSFTQAPEDYGFSKTLVPVRLLEYGDEDPLVVSRSQAKRLMVRFDRFENIVLDFSGIREIGQGFADELFRVFPSRHPGSTLYPIHCSEAVERMIARVTRKKE